jgi:hypothetical protein
MSSESQSSASPAHPSFPEVAAGDPFVVAAARRKKTERTTRHHRCDYPFLDLLEEDFGIPHYALSNAFMGVPFPEPKKSAIALCEWAVLRTDEPARALLAWARKHGRGTFAPAFFEDDSESPDHS